MTRQHRPRPWHEIVHLKDELRTGELALAEFAADLHEVALAQGRRPVYEDPAKFFALTYPTHALRELVRDVAARLSGRSDKAVRQLELTYGGGKTHTLVALHHLFRDPAHLPDLPAVREFREHVGADLPAAFTATLCFDKIDAERGIEGVRGPGGETRGLRHPWSVLAFQLAGADGLRALHADGRDEERESSRGSPRRRPPRARGPTGAPCSRPSWRRPGRFRTSCRPFAAAVRPSRRWSPSSSTRSPSARRRTRRSCSASWRSLRATACGRGAPRCARCWAGRTCRGSSRPTRSTPSRPSA